MKVVCTQKQSVFIVLSTYRLRCALLDSTYTLQLTQLTNNQSRANLLVGCHILCKHGRTL